MLIEDLSRGLQTFNVVNLYLDEVYYKKTNQQKVSLL